MKSKTNVVLVHGAWADIAFQFVGVWRLVSYVDVRVEAQRQVSVRY
jgi:hypothetical protein